jgi:hypothetical protein
MRPFVGLQFCLLNISSATQRGSSDIG